jgi:hypothetical protein
LYFIIFFEFFRPNLVVLGPVLPSSSTLQENGNCGLTQYVFEVGEVMKYNAMSYLAGFARQLSKILSVAWEEKIGKELSDESRILASAAVCPLAFTY